MCDLIRIPAEDYLGRVGALAENLVEILASRGETLAGAESCTAGLVADSIARIPGASRVFWGSYVCYTVNAKSVMLYVKGKLVKKYGAVSRPVALAMAEGAFNKSNASWAFSVTGLAGPDGDGTDTPVGTVWIAVTGRDGKVTDLPRTEAKAFLFSGGEPRPPGSAEGSGSRGAIREAAAAVVFEELLKRIREKPPER